MLQLIIVSFSVIRYGHINGCLCQCAYVMRIMRSFAEINKFSHMLLFNSFSTYLCSISPRYKIVSEYNQKIKQSLTADKPMAS